MFSFFGRKNIVSFRYHVHAWYNMSDPSDRVTPDHSVTFLKSFTAVSFSFLKMDFPANLKYKSIQLFYV
ncbi:hypothetical protein SAMN05443550_10840 [Pedobacter hartonius]|uniref:Uncharacterized protein n=1 Tax=Pedobacter hartonius TaxID=425514 RepID=A0A1H4FPI3_9SPHI|nr:hypothetical protein SAMN05443550_10840 [Pedobacter hartonius]